jgi:hypothetical protein
MATNSKDLHDVPVVLLSTRKAMKLLLDAYIEGIKDCKSGVLKGFDESKLKSFIEPKLFKILNENSGPKGNEP